MSNFAPQMSAPASRTRCALFWLAILAFTGCSASESGDGDGAGGSGGAGGMMAADASMTADASAQPDADALSPEDAGMPDAEMCPPGDEGCPCMPDALCNEGHCVEGVCTLCEPGAQGCVCNPDDTCSPGGRCEDGLCGRCPSGEEGCPCGANDFCAGELTCTEGTCATPECVAGTLGCPCEAGACGPDQGYCGADNLCQACSPEVEGCPCDEEGACGGDLICGANTTCVLPETCEDLACVEHQRCREPELAGELPRCLEACEEGYAWNPETEQCDDALPPGQVCDPASPESIAADCDRQNRQCVEEAPGMARCGDCAMGFVDEDGACRAGRTCAELNCGGQNRGCEDNPRGDDACGACLEGFIEEDGRCVEPPAQDCAELNCAAQNRTCNDGPPPICAGCLAGFMEEAGQCVAVPEANCDAGDAGSILAACQMQNRTCMEQAGGAVCGGCAHGFVEHQGACVPPVLCADLNCLAQGRTCAGDPMAQCGGCAPGFVADGNRCVAAVFCEDLGCDRLGRQCAGEPMAQCGECQPGSFENPEAPGGACLRPLTCADIACMEGEFCVEGRNGQDAFCNDRPCLAGEAFREDRNACVVCDLLCGEPGETGRIYPYTQTFSDNCLCETQTGFYADVAGAIRAKPCDADGDGWVRVSARGALESEDSAIRENARCDLREVDRVVLSNEYRQFYGYRFCEEGVRGPGEGACEDVQPVGLYESVRNDDSVELARDPDAPAYADGGIGRRLRADEVNPLTKACVSAFADYNDNGLADVSEHQAMDAPDGLDPALRPFVQFSAFTELHAVQFFRPEGQMYGQLVIAERSRCSDLFPMTYAEGEGDWWRQCSRNRDATWDNNPERLAPVGYDFAWSTCNQAQGTCTTQPPPVEALGGPDVPAHGLCEIPLPTPIHNAWRGMNHHSQFRCVQIAAQVDLPADRNQAPHLMLPGELYNGVQNAREWQFNQCRIACPPDDPACGADCGADGCEISSEQPGGLANPASAVLDCSAVVQNERDQAVAVGRVGWVSARYSADEQYIRGCINEWETPGNPTLYRSLCPGYLRNPDAVVGDANDANFGRILCGCGFGYGGEECDLGCPEAAIDTNGDGRLDLDVGPLHFGGPEANNGASCAEGYCPINDIHPDGGRLGYWMCGGFGVTSPPVPEGAAPADLNGGGYSLRGEVAPDGLTGEALCGPEGCEAGFSVRLADPR